MNLKKISFKELEKVLNKYDKNEYFDDIDELITEDNSNNLFDNLTNCFSGRTNQKSILGIDIYKYSLYPEWEQNLIPFIFKMLINDTNKSIEKYEKYLFPNGFMKNNNQNKDFIDTGDGGFFNFDTPLHSLAYSIHFANHLRRFNSYLSYPILRKKLKELTLRYAMTFDSIYFLDDNYYGTAIINNSRILSKDKLNRFLVDENTVDWFLKNINGIENIRRITYHDIGNLKCFKDYNINEIEEIKYGAFSKTIDNSVQVYGIDTCDLQKIGFIKSKEQVLSIYSLHFQFLCRVFNTDQSKGENLTYTLGNMNSTGLECD